MRTYETTFIINPQTDDASIDREVQSVSDLITQNGGKILHEDRFGTRRLAYQLKGLTQGFYTSFIFEAPAQVLPLLDRHFKLGELYLRHLTILCEQDLKATTEPEEAETAAKEEVKSTDAAAVPETPRADATPQPTTEGKTPLPKGQPVKAVEKEGGLEPGKQAGLEEEEEL